MPDTHRLAKHARVVLILNVLYNIADALCSVFVGVYFYIHSLRFEVVCIALCRARPQCPTYLIIVRTSVVQKGAIVV